MRALFLFFLFVLGLLSSFFVTSEKAYAQQSNKVINDSLVQNLSCRTLNVDNIYRAIRADAFAESRNMPVRNWPFRSGLATIAGCWALSSTQRMVSYMARYNTPDNRRMDQRVPRILDMVRRSKLEAKIGGNNHDYPNNNSQQQPFISRDLSFYTVFPVPEGSLYESSKDYQNGLWNGLMRGYEQEFNGQRVSRNFKDEIEANQASHFFRASNITLAMGSGARAGGTNVITAQQLMKNLDGKRLTLINLRAGRTAQHVVMVKSYQKLSARTIAFTVYDSNNPSQDATVYFSTNAQQFYAPDIVGRFVLENETRALGVYIVDEGERTQLEAAMLAHYKVLCR
ncbi:hypothetical protein [Bdellovibrio sp. HCB-162]|uniref:hypothetical protein n=1 Tax=Bdellovibrio sp. HCB-162 TaxID=3394234 RepID=UPI0039BC3D2E